MVNGENGIGEYSKSSTDIDSPEAAKELLNQLFELSKNHADKMSNGAFSDETSDGTGDMFRHTEPDSVSFLKIEFSADRFRPEIVVGQKPEDYRILYTLDVTFYDEMSKDQLDPRYLPIYYEAQIQENLSDPWLRQTIEIGFSYFMEGNEKVIKSDTSITTTIGFHMYEFGSDGVPRRIDDDDDIFEDVDEVEIDESSDEKLKDDPIDIQNVINEFELLTDDLYKDVMLNRHDIITALRYLNIVITKQY